MNSRGCVIGLLLLITLNPLAQERSNSKSAYIDTTTLVKDSLGLFILSDDLVSLLKEKFYRFQYSLNDTDYHEHLSYYDPRMFQIEGLEMENLAKKYKEQYKSGQSYSVKNVLINGVSPMIKDSGYYWMMIDTRIDMEIIYANYYATDPETFIGIVKDGYGPHVYYDKSSRSFHINDRFIFYVTVAMDTLDFHFLKGTFFRMPELSKFASFNTIATLKKYE